MPDQLPDTLRAGYETARDGDGPYFPIYVGNRMIAYAIQEQDADLIVCALNTCNKAVAESLAEARGTVQ